jgi:hypothetical protein
MSEHNAFPRHSQELFHNFPPDKIFREYPPDGYDEDAESFFLEIEEEVDTFYIWVEEVPSEDDAEDEGESGWVHP